VTVFCLLVRVKIPTERCNRSSVLFSDVTTCAELKGQRRSGQQRQRWQ
jgi:hypothetical protein